VWLGTRQQLAKLTTTELPLLSALVRSARPGRQHRRPAHHGWSRRHVTPVVPISTTPATDGSSLTLKAAKTLVHAFVSSRLDYCNSLLYGIGDGLLTKLQTVQNAAARVVTGTKKFDHITPVLRQLHWLPVCQRIIFKLAMITFKCLHGLAPSYLADVCIPVSSVVGKWQLRSANSGALVVPCTSTTIGQRDFAVAGPATWNSLPVDLQTSSLSRDTFAKKLKTSLIGRYTNWHIHSFIQRSPIYLILKPSSNPLCSKFRCHGNEGRSGKNSLGIIQWPIPANPPIDAKILQIFLTQTEL